ncbi:cupin domain-containing protein [Nocardia sp. AG03]|uniref:cupin domain-containing protein n=1 Tax=Nocardia sp. AG03 TaxID=3025312 RepID=UPI0024185E3A|nr:cupin domain-containing protein [Nocardia sp. AG03]
MSTLVTDTTTWQPKDGDLPNIQRLLAGPGITLVRLSFRAGQVLDEHRAPGPILISCVSGVIDLDVTAGGATEAHRLEPGATIYLAAGDPHRLEARADAVVHLTLQRDITPG